VNFERKQRHQVFPRPVLPRRQSFLKPLGLVLCFISSAIAQLDRAALTGTVTDSSGRALPETTVVVQQAATGLRRAATTSRNGVYSIPELPVGAYTVGTHLLTLSEVNVVNPLTGVRPFPAFGQIDWRGNASNSEYEALSVALRRSVSRGLLLSANYTWSHEIDDGSNGSGDGDSLTPQNVACQPCERASGAFDVRHVLNVNAMYELPFGGNRPYLNQPGVLRNILGSWEINAILSARTGFPVNVTLDRSSSDVPDGNTNNQRPNLVPGAPLTPPGGRGIAEWINPAAFSVPAPGTFGNAPRNLARAPGTWQADMGIAKRVTLTERAQLQFRTDIFNLFNHSQYAAPQADLSSGPGVFASIISTVNTGPVGTGTPRQIQFMLRLSF